MVLIVALFVAIFLWPLSFSNGITNDAELFVYLIHLGSDNGIPKNVENTYEFQSDSEEIKQI
jgi:hypothetical protein